MKTKVLALFMCCMPFVLLSQSDVRGESSIMPIANSDMSLEQQTDIFFNSIPKRKLAPMIHQEKVDLSIFKEILYFSEPLEESLLVNKINDNNNYKGFNFVINGRYNLHNTTSPDLVTGERSRYNTNIGFEWNVLKNGWKDGKINKQRLTNEFEIKRLERKINRDQEQLAYHEVRIKSIFNQILLDELKYHYALLDKQVYLFQEMYFKNLAPYTEIINLKKDRKQVEIQANQLKNFHKHIDKKLIANIQTLPIFDLDLDAIINTYNDNTALYDTLAMKQKELLKNSYRDKALPTLSVVALYRIFESESNGTSNSSPALGVNFRMPIHSYQKNFLNNSIRLEGQIVDEQLRLKKEADIRLITELYTTYQSILKEIKGLYYQIYAEKEHYQSGQIMKQVADKESKIHTFSHLNNILRMRRDIITHQEQLYLIAMNLFSIAGTDHLSPTTNMVKAINWEEVRPSQSFITLDTNKDLKNIQFIVNYLKRKNYHKIYLKGERTENYILIERMLKLEGFKVYSTISQTIPRLEVNSFKSIDALKRHLILARKNYLLNDFHTLFELERKGYKRDLFFDKIDE